MNIEKIKADVSRIALLAEILEDHLANDLGEASKYVSRKLYSEINGLNDTLSNIEPEKPKKGSKPDEVKVPDEVKAPEKKKESIVPKVVSKNKVDNPALINTADKLKTLNNDGAVKPDANGLI